MPFIRSEDRPKFLSWLTKTENDNYESFRITPNHEVGSYAPPSVWQDFLLRD